MLFFVQPFKCATAQVTSTIPEAGARHLGVKSQPGLHRKKGMVVRAFNNPRILSEAEACRSLIWIDPGQSESYMDAVSKEKEKKGKYTGCYFSLYIAQKARNWSETKNSWKQNIGILSRMFGIYLESQHLGSRSRMFKASLRPVWLTQDCISNKQINPCAGNLRKTAIYRQVCRQYDPRLRKLSV